MKILVVEDEKKVASFIKKGLEEETEFVIDLAFDGEKGLRMALNNDYVLIILDLNLPEIQGFEVCRKIREKKNFPILMLTAMGTIEDKVTGLELGADDYLVKPFHFKELLARVKAILRRPPLAKKIIYKIADLELNTETKIVSRAGKELELTVKEYGLLEYFLKNQGKVLSRSEIAENVWDLNFDTGTNIVDVYVNYLRKKIDKNFEPQLVHTVIGHGYILKEQ